MWATSIGSTFSHSPVPGERKSGIPEGTEMPAPVSATTERAPATSAAKRSRSALTVAAANSAPAEPSSAFAEEGGDALLRVGAGEHLGECLLLGLETGVEAGVDRDALDRGDGQRGLPGQLARPQQGRVEQLVVVDNAVDEA